MLRAGRARIGRLVRPGNAARRGEKRCDSFTKLRQSSCGCESRPTKGEPARSVASLATVAATGPAKRRRASAWAADASHEVFTIPGVEGVKRPEDNSDVPASGRGIIVVPPLYSKRPSTRPLAPLESSDDGAHRLGERPRAFPFPVAPQLAEPACPSGLRAREAEPGDCGPIMTRLSRSRPSRTRPRRRNERLRTIIRENREARGERGTRSGAKERNRANRIRDRTGEAARTGQDRT